MTYKRSDIEAEYNTASQNEQEYLKVKWGSHEKMINRFKLAEQMLTLSNKLKWLDVGSGTGIFQQLIADKYPELECYGVDLSAELVKFANNKPLSKNIRIILADFLELDLPNVKFDILTCIGVLQKTNMSLANFFNQASKLSKPKSQLFIDTKNKNWEKFNLPEYSPETEHDWLDLSLILEQAKAANFNFLRAGGFLPETGEITEVNKSHNMFILFERNA